MAVTHTPPHQKDFDRALLTNAIRALAIDAVEKANSGHQGMPMGMAQIAVALWQRHLKHNPEKPSWPNRDRSVLSNGHRSMLLYRLLHLTRYEGIKARIVSLPSPCQFDRQDVAYRSAV
jgi:transketolase